MWKNYANNFMGCSFTVPSVGLAAKQSALSTLGKAPYYSSIVINCDWNYFRTKTPLHHSEELFLLDESHIAKFTIQKRRTEKMTRTLKQFDSKLYYHITLKLTLHAKKSMQIHGVQQSSQFSINGQWAYCCLLLTY